MTTTPQPGWAETPGGSLLGSLIADAFARAERHDDEIARIPASDVGTEG